LPGARGRARQYAADDENGQKRESDAEEDGSEQKAFWRFIETERVRHQNGTRRPCRGLRGEDVAPPTLGKTLPDASGFEPVGQRVEDQGLPARLDVLPDGPRDID